ncbi:RipA family octameric membrane protein [Peribacillus butanolivorans]|uniref:RipA family octameric membrane protein n=1 Tax=Peribacillus butanolivorans TaxID=421767 RepID=UPI0036491D3C
MKEIDLKEYQKCFEIIENNENGSVVKIDGKNVKSSSSQEDKIGKSSSNEVTKEALKQALDIRKFEIEMYWKRATYFWTIIGVIFAGYFLLMSKDVLDSQPTLIFLLNCIGFIFSLSWYLVNRGSKFWQNNWEKHVDLLEDKVMGPLYKTVIQNSNLKIYHLHKEYNYSVSKINQILSLIVTIIWALMGIFFIIKFGFKVSISDKLTYIFKHYFHYTLKHQNGCLLILIALCTALASYLLLKYGKSDSVNQGLGELEKSVSENIGSRKTKKSNTKIKRSGESEIRKRENKVWKR